MIVYKIRDADGNYSTGGNMPSFRSKGKTWNSKGALNNHFTALMQHRKFYGLGGIEKIYAGCEVVELEMAERSVIPVADWQAARKKS